MSIIAMNSVYYTTLPSGMLWMEVTSWNDSLSEILSTNNEGHLDVARLLLENGADPNINDETGNYDDDDDKDSLLYKFTKNGNEKVEKLLLKYGSTPLSENDKQKILNERLLEVCDSKNIKVVLEKLRDAVKIERKVLNVQQWEIKVFLFFRLF